MPPKGGNAKKESGKAKKAENEAKKKEQSVAEKEKKEAETWKDDSKVNKAQEKEEKRKAELARKAENARILAEEEASTSSKPKPAASKGGKKGGNVKPVAAAGIGELPDLDDPASKGKEREVEGVESYAASGLDNALDLLEVVTAKTDKASVGQQAAGIERHPERRFKAAFEAYLERELPIAKEDHPGLRLNQYKDLLLKQFNKSPDNPFNQTIVSYDATKEDKVDALKAKNEQVAERLRER